MVFEVGNATLSGLPKDLGEFPAATDVVRGSEQKMAAIPASMKVINKVLS